MNLSSLESKKRLTKVLEIAQGSRSRRAFSKMLGVSPTAVLLWERGESIPDLENLMKIAELSGYTLEELIYYLTEKTVPQPDLLDKMLKEIQQMPLEEVIKITSAGIQRIEKAFHKEEISKVS